MIFAFLRALDNRGSPELTHDRLADSYDPFKGFCLQPRSGRVRTLSSDSFRELRYTVIKKLPREMLELNGAFAVT